VASTDATHDDLSLQPDEEDQQVQKTTNFNVSSLESNLERTALEQSGVDATAVDMGSTKSATRLDKSSTRSATAVSKTMRSQAISGLDVHPTVVTREIKIQPAWILVTVVCAISLIWCCGVVMSFVSGNSKEKTMVKATTDQQSHELNDLDLVYGVQNHEIITFFTSMSKGNSNVPGMEAWGEDPYKKAAERRDKPRDVIPAGEEKKSEEKEAKDTKEDKDAKKTDAKAKKKSEDEEEDEDTAKEEDKGAKKDEGKKDEGKKDEAKKDDAKKDEGKKEEPKKDEGKKEEAKKD
jgi:hypothetical protein